MMLLMLLEQADLTTSSKRDEFVTLTGILISHRQISEPMKSVTVIGKSSLKRLVGNSHQDCLSLNLTLTKIILLKIQKGKIQCEAKQFTKCRGGGV